MTGSPLWDVGNNPSASRESAALALLIVLTVLSTLCVGLHLLGLQRRGRQRLWFDDWILIIALITSIGANVNFLLILRYGGAGYLPGMSWANFATYMKLELAFIEIATFAVPCFKFSLLFLYWRLFPKKWFRTSCLVTGIILAINTVVAEIFYGFQCSPTAYYWDRLIPGGKCINIKTALFTFSIINMLSAIATAVFATVIIWSLHISRRKRIMLSGIFLIGLPIIGVSIARLYATRLLDFSPHPKTDGVWASYFPCFLSCIEGSLGVVSAAVPGMTPLFRSDFIGSRPTNNTTPQTPSFSPSAGRGSRVIAYGGIHAVTTVDRSSREWRDESLGSNSVVVSTLDSKRPQSIHTPLWRPWNKPGMHIDASQTSMKDIELLQLGSHFVDPRDDHGTFLESACSNRVESCEESDSDVGAGHLPRTV